MMKKSRLTRLFSLFAALMMCVSLLSAVASASDSGIQPHGPSCPACGRGETYFRPNKVERDPSPFQTCPQTGKAHHFRLTEYQVLHCENCNSDQLSRIRSGMQCRIGGQIGPCQTQWY